ncbi:DNA mismatch repair msh3 [Lecanosticta acicola]|uniref:DNA mismatch repair protein MSH3 n=1 Tax=Lecanosticta acicola TaxID=111012 RepID=A0AAI9E916_9PEZI|nr:DNA mismatch repair msh3 [Lecanosticta acicola]
MKSSQPPTLTQSSSQKKQQSISNFFKSKPAATPTNDIQESHGNGLFVSDDGELPDTNGTRKTSKRPVEDEAEDITQPVPKRRKESPDIEKHELSTSKDHGVEKAPKATGRTSKYAFSSSPAADGNIEEEEEPDDEEARRTKQRLHQKFVKKLGRPDSIADIKRRNGFITEETQGEDDAEEEEEGEREPSPPQRKGKKAAPAQRGRGKLTPGEQQIVDLKRKHPDALLLVETGYKYKLWGEDARVAAKVLAIVCIPGKYRFDEHPSEAHLNRFASASFPTHRLHVHVKRLVSAGHKVGIVRQLETAALKAAGSNRSKLFERGLTNLYTKGTYIDDQEGLDLAGADGGAPATGHLLCLTESYPKGSGSDEKVQIGMVAVQPSTGDIVYDDFEDGWMRSELETRLLHISPCEFLVVGELSKATEKLVQHLSGGDDARLERVDKPKTMAAQAYSHITKFYADKMKDGGFPSSQVQSSQETGTLLDKAHRLSENATICLSAMITHLTDYGLQHVFDLTKYFQSFSARSHMLLNGNTLTSLELYRNQTDQSEHGSLFWTLNRTQTKFGRRLLRKWVGRPLLDRARLDERIAAVEELKDGHANARVDRVRRLLSRVRADLEKTLIRIYYKKCSRPELLALLQTLQMVANEYSDVTSPAEAGFQSAMINEAIASLPCIADDVLEYLNRLNAEAAKSDDKYDFFREPFETEDITDHKVGIVAVEHDLNEFKNTAAEILKRKQVTYVTSADVDYLIELDNAFLKNVPASWVKVSGTKKVSRYHAPEVAKLLRERDQHKEALTIACDAAFRDLLTEIGSKYQAFRDCVQSLALLDCLLSHAEIAQQPGYCKPTFRDEPGISIAAGRHPMVEQVLPDPFVPNDVRLSSEGTRALLITGPNMGGKSSYVRSVALIAIMAQIGSYVPADSAELGLLDAVFTRMGAFDNMLKGESTFMVELGETSDILKQATPRSLVILDELGRGTSTHDGVAIAQSVLSHVVSEIKSFTLFITHYQSLARMAGHWSTGGLKNVHMRFTERDSETADGEKDITFLYEVGNGIAHRSYGLNVARLAGLPKSLLEEAGRQSKKMEEEEGQRKMNYLARAVGDVVSGGGDGGGLQRLIAGIEQL